MASASDHLSNIQMMKLRRTFSQDSSNKNELEVAGLSHFDASQHECLPRHDTKIPPSGQPRENACMLDLCHENQADSKH